MISKFNETILRFLSCFQLGGQNYVDASGNYTSFFCINIKKWLHLVMDDCNSFNFKILKKYNHVCI